MENILEVKHLKKYFGKSLFPAINDISFSIGKGEVLGLVGESGCGKTTTGRSIIKLYDITDGEIYFKGHRISAGIQQHTEKIKQLHKVFKKEKTTETQNELRNQIIEEKEQIQRKKYDTAWCDRDYFQKTGEHLITKMQMIFQDPVSSLDPRMTIREIIAEGLIVQHIHNEEYITKTVNEMLETVGLLPEYADRYPHEFSGGQRQRIGIARTLVMNPELIIADEPVSALDVSIQAQIINLLNNLRKQKNLSLLFIAHDLSVVKYFSDRIAVMYFGKIVETASSDELFQHPLHPYTKSLLSAIPLPDPDYEKHRKRTVYNPSVEHNYITDKPVLQEILPGHSVYCNHSEFSKYKASL